MIGRRLFAGSSRRCFALLRFWLFAFFVLVAARPSFGACGGDCNGDGEVTVDEILKGINIALGTSPLSGCRNGDRDGSGEITVDELLVAVNAALLGCAPEPIFPASYRDSFVEVRDCRFSSEHDFTYIRVLTNPIAALPYKNDGNPLPVGSVVVKEEFASSDCRDSSLLRWRVMRKEAPGFDTQDGDWHWQWVNADRSVRFDDKSTCISCHVRPECLARDHMCTVGGVTRGKMELVLTKQPAALLSIAGTSATDVYAVGADPSGDEFGPYILHYDGLRWRRLSTGATGDLWWISTTPIDGSFYMVGEGGLVLRYDPELGKFTKLTTSFTSLLFGVWGSSASDIWVVGGDPNNEDGGGALEHFDGISWTAVELPDIFPNGLPTLFKVWGRAANDVYAVGRLGTVLHFDGTGWSRAPSNSVRPLFTVHGNDSVVVAVGGFSDGVILELDGEQFVDRSAPGTPQMNGVFVPPDNLAVAAGITGSLALRGDAGWDLPDTGLNTTRDFHSVWVDPDGGIWAVGGDLTVDLVAGLVAYSGQHLPGSDVVPLSLCPPPLPQPDAVTTVSYTRDVVPLLNQTGCLSASCHGSVFPSSGYDLRSYEKTFGPGVLAQGLKRCEVVPGNPDISFLLDKLGPTPVKGERMPQPPRAPLTAGQIELMRTWILEGALNDGAPTATPSPTSRTPTSRPTATPTKAAAGACADPGIICTVAGTGKSLFDGDGKAATQTSLYYPLGVTFDAQGRAIIVDWNNLRLRRINDNGTVETIMGTGSEAFPTDGAQASDTPLHHASEARFDGMGRLFVAGDHVPVVFRIDADGRVHTVAGTTEVGNSGDGGPALEAELTTPFGVLPSADGGLYIADVDAHVIRFVAANGTISTIAGTGQQGYSGDGGAAAAAKLAGPARMRFDADGNLYFTEVKNHVVRRVAVDGTISTVAGSGSRGYSGDGGQAKRARFDSPYDLAIGPQGDLFIADTGNSVVRRVDAAGMVATVVGTGISGFGGDGGAALACELNRPSGVTFAPNGDLWISDTFNNRVRRVTASPLAMP